MRYRYARHGWCWLAACFAVLTGCLAFPPSQSYEQATVNYTAYQGVYVTGRSASTTTVHANQRWQASGVALSPNTHVKVVAMGKWSAAANFNVWNNADGADAPWHEVPWIKSYALMAKIGEQGKPFAIGAAQEFTATGAGELFFAMNDPFEFLNDNAGSLQVSVYTVPATSPRTAASSTASPPVPQREAGGPRTALVIGNSRYATGPLRNPEHDARDMAAALRQLGFDVTMRVNANQQDMERAIHEFGRALYRGGVGLFYYAGHGVQVDGHNYLIPTEARIESESDVRYKAVNVGHILGKMGEARNGLNIVILDACRDNPFTRSFRSATRGLAVVADASPKGTLIAFATSPGKVASDGDAENGLYTTHLLRNMQVPGLSVEQVFKRVLQGVEADTQGKQSPWTSSSFSGEFSFVPQ